MDFAWKDIDWLAREGHTCDAGAAAELVSFLSFGMTDTVHASAEKCQLTGFNFATASMLDYHICPCIREIPQDHSGPPRRMYCRAPRQMLSKYQ